MTKFRERNSAESLIESSTFPSNPDSISFSTPQKPKRVAEISTPIQIKISQINAAAIKAHMTTPSKHCMKLVSLTTILADHLTNSTPVKNRVASKHDQQTLETSDSIDYLANVIVMHTRDSQVDTTSKRYTPSIHKQQHTEEKTITTTCSKIFNTGSKTSMLPSMGSYSKIAHTVQKIITKFPDAADTSLAHIIRSVSNGFKVESLNLLPTDIKFIVDLTALLLGEECHRNTASHLINNMFIDLVEEGILTFKDLPKVLPMAFSKAVMASRTLDYHCFQTIKTHTPYDKSSKMHDINAKEVKTLISRSNQIILKWLELKGANPELLEKENLEGDNLHHITQLIRQGINTWYGITINTLPQHDIDEQIDSSYSSSKSYTSSPILDWDTSIPNIDLALAQADANIIIGDLFDSN